ncbi:hypothetical protein CYY_004761 [Polysphondylium violaceum]|uniref:phytol kinase n=1 Tax=Polysphondylium violaceum TaxID=133409 RepID=A0A8J4V4U9_9MYCE|nr:hypothetical protein CYY_004761 [Polysphondylium violaceum]
MEIKMILVYGFFKTLAICLVWLKITQFLTKNRITSNPTSRKIIHIGTGFIYVMCWSFFPERDPFSRYAVALVPFLISLQFTLIALGYIKDRETVNSMSRSGRAIELLYGPVSYGIVLTLCTVWYWTESPIGVTSLCILCFGDGFAGLFGALYGRKRLPINSNKTYVGSISFLVFSFFGTILLLHLMQMLGLMYYLSITSYIPSLAITCFVCCLVESLPIEDWDNVSVFLASINLLRFLGW